MQDKLEYHLQPFTRLVNRDIDFKAATSWFHYYHQKVTDPGDHCGRLAHSECKQLYEPRHVERPDHMQRVLGLGLGLAAISLSDAFGARVERSVFLFCSMKLLYL